MHPCDKLVEQRSKDLKGIVGQVRGFDVDEFLSDWEQPGHALPWALGNHDWVTSQLSAPWVAPAPASVGAMSHDPVPTQEFPDTHLFAGFAQLMATAGVSPKLRILFVPHHMPAARRLPLTTKLYRDLCAIFLGFDVQLAFAEGPLRATTA